MAERLSSLHVGSAGEHYVAMRLALAGLDVGLVPANTAGVDLLVHRAGVAASVQVKARGPHLGAGESVDMTPVKIRLTDFLAVVVLGGDAISGGLPFAYVLPRAEGVEWVELFGDRHPTRPCTRMNAASREWLAPYREAWELVSAYVGP